MAADGVPVRVRLDPPAFDLDVAAIDAAITPRTRAVLINTPHNPTGRIYPIERPPGARRACSRGARRGSRPSDPARSATSRTTGSCSTARTFHSPAEVYPNTIVDLLVRQDAARARDADRLRDGAADDARPRGAPRRRSSSPRSRPATRSRTRCSSTRSRTSSGCRSTSARSSDGATGWCPPSARSATRRRCPRGRSTSWPARRSPTTRPSRSSWPSHGALVLPGTVVEVPGWFRISLTASDEMVERGLRSFASAIEAVPPA